MNEEVKKLFSNLSDKDQKEIANLIRFKNEVKYHDKQFEELLQQYIELAREHDKLQINWDELKKYAEENLYFYSGYQGEDLEEDLSIKDILDKMQELEGNDE